MSLSCTASEILSVISQKFKDTDRRCYVQIIAYRWCCWCLKNQLTHANFVKFGRREIGEIVRYLPDKKFACLSDCRYCADLAQNLPGPAPNNVLRVLQISSKWVRGR